MIGGAAQAGQVEGLGRLLLMMWGDPSSVDEQRLIIVRPAPQGVERCLWMDAVRLAPHHPGHSLLIGWAVRSGG